MGALGNASQALGCRIFQCHVNRSPPWLTAHREPLLPGTSPTDEILAGEGQIFLSGILFFGAQLFFCCPSSIRIAMMEIEKGEKKKHQQFCLFPRSPC